jgi:predicted MFS family arabinose efflux permease
MPRTVSLWRNHDFMLLWTGETVSSLGSSMSFFVFPLLGYGLTGSSSQAALAGSAYALGNVAARLPAGALVDRWNRKRTLVTANAVGAVLYAGLAAALLVHRLSLVHLVGAALLTGVVGAFFSPAEQAALRTVVPAVQLPTAYSQNQARQHVAELIGPPAGGALYSLFRWAPFLVDAVTFAISALALTRLATALPAPVRVQPPTTLRTDIAEGVRFLLSRGFLRAITVSAALCNFSVSALFFVLTLKLLRAGVQPAAIGAIDTIGASAALVGAIAAPALIRRVPTGALTICVLLLISAAIVPMAFTNDVVLIGLLLAAGLFLLPAGNAAIVSYLVAMTPDRLQGRANAALNFIAMLFTPLAPITGGLLIEAWGAKPAMLAAAGLTALSILPLLLSADTRRLPIPDRWVIETDTASSGQQIR